MSDKTTMPMAIEVCSACLRASCWLGHFYCEDYKTAGTEWRSIADLRRLNLESEDYWNPAHEQD